MGKPHKYAEVIKAWADGKVIQFRKDERITCDCGWRDWKPDFHNASPEFSNLIITEWRIKPEKKKYRILEVKDIYGKPYPSLVNTDGGAALVSNQSEFVRWVTDWIEYE